VKVEINKLHNMLGHIGKDATFKTAKYYGWKITGTWEDCDDFGIAKAKQGYLNKVPVDRSKICAERILIDISSNKAMSYGQSKFWLQLELLPKKK
jgi:hypothetical protein